MKKNILLFTLFIFSFIIKSQIPSFTINNLSASYSVTCNTPTINLSVSPLSYTYSWVNSPLTFTSNLTSVSLTSLNIGSFTVTATNTITGLSSSQIFFIGIDISVPISTVSPLSQSIVCNSSPANFTNAVSFPSSNVSTSWFYPNSPYPLGAASVSNGTLSIGSIGIPGTATVLTCNIINGCCNSKTVNVISSSSFPTFSLISTTNFSIGCATPVNQSTVCMTGALGSGSLTYAFLPPTSTLSIPIPTTNFNNISCSILNTAGTWTMIVRDQLSGCQAYIPTSIISNTTPPNVSISISNQTLSCINPTLLTIGNTTTSNSNISWMIPFVPYFLASPNVIIGPSSGTYVGTGPMTNTLQLNPYAIYTVVATNTINQCSATQTIQIYQNFYAPQNIGISIGSQSVITCTNPCVSLTFTNATLSTSLSVPSNTWVAPSSSTSTLVNFNACFAGTYSLIVMDSQNGCSSNTVINITSTAPVISVNSATYNLSCLTNTIHISPSYTGAINNLLFLYTSFPTGASFSIPNATIIPGISTPSVIVDKPGVYYITTTNTVTTCIKNDSITVLNCFVGIAENKKNDLVFNLFPNPATEQLNIKCEDFNDNDVYKIEIYNSIGQLIKEEDLTFKNQTATINTKDLQSGVYVLKLSSRGTRDLSPDPSYRQDDNLITVSKRFVIAR